MIRPSILAILSLCAVCSFCGKDFVTLGRHSWRCKQRANQANQTGSENSTVRAMPAASSPTVVISNRTAIKCCCGKLCKGTRGLNSRCISVVVASYIALATNFAQIWKNKLR